jgi:uncharacterized protein with HEPN domain
MQPEALKLLEDVRDAGAFVLETTAELSLGEYLENRLVRQAVERNLQIIGEAMNRLRKVSPAVADKIGQVARIVAFRNILVHGYDMLDHEIVWQVIRDDLPALVDQSRVLLSNISDRS